MTFDIGEAIEDGLAKTPTRAGVEAIVALVAIGVALSLVSSSLVRTTFEAIFEMEAVVADVPPEVVADTRQQLETQFPVNVVDAPVGVLAALVVGLWLAQTVVRIGAIRWFVEERTGGLSFALFTRRLLWTVGNLILGAILYAAAVTVGLILLVVPGIFLAVALFFYNYEIIVEGENAIEALSNSYELTKGYRLQLFLLGLVFAIVGGIIAQVGNPALVPDPVVASVLGSAVSAAFGVVGIAVAAAAYRQLREEPATGDAEEVGALGPDDL